MKEQIDQINLRKKTESDGQEGQSVSQLTVKVLEQINMLLASQSQGGVIKRVSAYGIVLQEISALYSKMDYEDKRDAKKSIEELQAIFNKYESLSTKDLQNPEILTRQKAEDLVTVEENIKHLYALQAKYGVATNDK